jgi:Fic/DOC family
VLAADSRPVHRDLFENLTPAGCEYFAGHYRGEALRCLRYCPVHVQNDPRVGLAPEKVPAAMDGIATSIRQGLGALDGSTFAAHEKLMAVVVLACRLFELVLRVHPYVNGNGHSARFIVFAILGRYGYWPERWSIDPRPGNPDYVAMIVACSSYRNGNPQPLEEFMLRSILGAERLLLRLPRTPRGSAKRVIREITFPSPRAGPRCRGGRHRCTRQGSGWPFLRTYRRGLPG